MRLVGGLCQTEARASLVQRLCEYFFFLRLRAPVLNEFLAVSRIPDQVAWGAPLGSSPVCFGSASSKPGSSGDEAALARSVSSGSCSVALTTLLCRFSLLRLCGAGSFSFAFFHLSLDLSAGNLSLFSRHPNIGNVSVYKRIR